METPPEDEVPLGNRLPSSPVRIAVLSLSLGLTAAIAVGFGALVERNGEPLADIVKRMAAHALWIAIGAALLLTVMAWARRRSGRR
jgi:hypothetical protein